MRMPPFAFAETLSRHDQMTNDRGQSSSLYSWHSSVVWMKLTALATVPRSSLLDYESVSGVKMQIKRFMFHDSTSVLPPVTRHAVHPADLHPFLWREIALALALSERGGGVVERGGISGFGVNVMQAVA